ncbi:MAG: hypothetical protein IPJ71_10940 [Bdellovibrionales bacterium]|nr:hypothetical protein [Bdellovibrionales bacterium]
MIEFKRFAKMWVSKSLILALPLLSLNSVHAMSCHDSIAGNPNYSSWYRVKMGQMGLPLKPAEHEALEGKQVAIFLKESLNFNKKEVVEGTLIHVPHLSDNNHATYDIQLADGLIRKVSPRTVKELRVNLPVSTATHESFTSKFKFWYKVKVNGGVPEIAAEYAALVGKYAAFYIDASLNFNQKEIVEGVILQVPVFGNDSRTTYDIQLADGSKRKIGHLYSIREIRIDTSR